MANTYEEYNKAFNELFQNYPFLAEEAGPFIPVQEYLNYFHRRYNKEFLFWCPSDVYSPKILNEFRDKMVYSAFVVPQPGQRQLVSLVQLSPESHIAINYLHNTKYGGFYLECNLYVTEGKTFLDFMEQYKSYVVKEEAMAKPFGFHKPITPESST
jgi:hypothetical protein